jgi:hypothetical protein
MERVVQSVRVYTFLKDGNNKGLRQDDYAVLAAGQTLRFMMQDHMYESKADPVFPTDLEWIEAFQVVEVMLNPSNSVAFDGGWGLNIGRIRPVAFSLHSLNTPLGLHLLPRSYKDSLNVDESCKGLTRLLETKNTGFFVNVQRGSYVVCYKDDEMRMVGPKDGPNPDSGHLEVASGIFAIDFSRDVMLRFVNGVEEDPSNAEFAEFYARFLIDLSAAAGALSFYVVANEYRLRKDPSRVPFTGVPLVDTNKLLDFIDTRIDEESPTFKLPFDVPTLRNAIASVCFKADDTTSPPCPCPDFALSSRGNPAGRSYGITFGDEHDPEMLTVFYTPKSRAITKQTERMDYHLCKKIKI